MTFDARREFDPVGLAGFLPGSANKGWIRVRGAAGTLPLYKADSVHGVAHTEERLCDWAEQKLGGRPGLAGNPADGPGVLELYTERRPCTVGTADDARRARAFGDCHSMLTALVHPTTVVHWSVANSLDGHNELMFRQAQRHLRYIALRRLSEAHAARANALGPGPHPALDDLLEEVRAPILALAAPTVQTFNAWREQLHALAGQGVELINGQL